MTIENKFKVKLIPASAIVGSRALTFDASPNISESRNVNYNSLEPLHAPGQIQVYKNTSSRTFQISDIKLLSRTIGEADTNLKKLWTLRSWCMPRFGKSSTLTSEQRQNRTDFATEDFVYESDEFGKELLGSPPPILYFSAYSKNIGSTTALTRGGEAETTWDIAQHINRIPTVIQQLTIPYPNDVDYITTSSGVPMPLIMNIDITLLESQSPNAFEAFSLSAFKEGRLQGF